MKIKKNILLSVGMMTTVVAPVVAVVSCGSKGQSGPAEVSFNFDSKAHTITSAKHLWDDFYKDIALDGADKGANVTISASHGAELTVNLTADEWKQVVTAGDVVQDVDDNTSLTDFVDMMKQVTGPLHQYYFDKAIGEKMGVDKSGVIHTSTKNYDETFTKKWLMDNLIHKMPNGISIKALNPNSVDNNIKVTFTNGTDSEDVDFHLAKAKNADEAKSKNEGGANPLAKVLDKVEKPFKSIFGSIKEFFKIAKTKVTKNDVKTLAKSILADATTGLVAGAAEFIPPVKVVLAIPIVGNKIEDFVNAHLISPITNKIVDSIV